MKNRVRPEYIDIAKKENDKIAYLVFGLAILFVIILMGLLFL